MLILLALAFQPLLRKPELFPENPRAEEIEAEIEALRSETTELVGLDRKRALVRIVRLERRLNEIKPTAVLPRRMPVWAWLVGGMVVLAVMGVLTSQTLPRLPGQTLTTTNVKQAREIKVLRIAAQRENTVAAWLTYANAAWSVRDINDAAEGYTKVLKQDPKNLTALRRFGILLFMSGRYAPAIEVLSAVTKIDPSVPTGFLFLGSAYYSEGRLLEATEAWKGYLAAGGRATAQVQNLIATAQAQLSAKTPGQRVYEAKCAVCHGAAAGGGMGPALAGNPIVRLPDAVKEIVNQGSGTMPSVPLNAEQMSNLLTYLKGL